MNTFRRIDCRRCQFYFVTWDEDFPHGCRRMGFKSRRSPDDEVRKAMQGEPCRLFEKKKIPELILHRKNQHG